MHTPLPAPDAVADAVLAADTSLWATVVAPFERHYTTTPAGHRAANDCACATVADIAACEAAAFSAGDHPLVAAFDPDGAHLGAVFVVDVFENPL